MTVFELDEKEKEKTAISTVFIFTNKKKVGERRVEGQNL